MSYELHIERPGRWLKYDEWTSAVHAIEGVQFETTRESSSADTDQTDGTASIRYDDQWVPVFYWHSGSVTFSPGIEDAGRLVPIALSLAEHMGPDVVVAGDEGEQYTRENLGSLVPGGL